jgi:hypothetical protein
MGFEFIEECPGWDDAAANIYLEGYLHRLSDWWCCVAVSVSDRVIQQELGWRQVTVGQYNLITARLPERKPSLLRAKC